MTTPATTIQTMTVPMAGKDSRPLVGKEATDGPSRLSWLEQRIYDALPDGWTRNLADVCRVIEANEPDYRTTETSVIRSLNDLQRRGIVRRTYQPGSQLWQRAETKMGQHDQTSSDDGRNIRMSKLSSLERRVVRHLVAERRPIGVAELAAATGSRGYPVEMALQRLSELGGVVTSENGWQATNDD